MLIPVISIGAGGPPPPPFNKSTILPIPIYNAKLSLAYFSLKLSKLF
jgi:hypothetical protein